MVLVSILAGFASGFACAPMKPMVMPAGPAGAIAVHARSESQSRVRAIAWRVPSTDGGITGRVRGNDGLALADATVVATSPGGEAEGAVTSSTGEFHVKTAAVSNLVTIYYCDFTAELDAPVATAGAATQLDIVVETTRVCP